MNILSLSANVLFDVGTGLSRHMHDDDWHKQRTDLVRNIPEYTVTANQSYLRFDPVRPVWIHILEESNLKRDKEKRKMKDEHGGNKEPGL